MKYCFALLLVFITANANAQSDKAAIEAVLSRQQAAWNQGNLVSFMKGYWENDSLMFIGKSGVTYGWQKTLENYQKGYPDTAAMGKLDFTFIEFKRLSKEYFYVTGLWHLTRSVGDLKGAFSLLMRKINNQWVIIKDHSS